MALSVYAGRVAGQCLLTPDRDEKRESQGGPDSRDREEHQKRDDPLPVAFDKLADPKPDIHHLTLDPISLAPLFLGVVVVFVLDGFATFPVRLGEDRGIDKVFADGEFRGRRRSSGGTGAGSGRVRQGKVERRFRRHAGWVTANEE